MNTNARLSCSAFPMSAVNSTIKQISKPQALRPLPRFASESITAMRTHIHKVFTSRFIMPFCVGLVVFCTAAPAQYGAWGKEYNDGSNLPGRCGSPRFIVKSGGDSTKPDAFALASTDVSVNIIGVLADVRIRQVYVNHSKNPLEATYIFPASTRAAVYAMNMQVKDRIINAVIKQKEEARQIYQQAVASGRTASLLEQLKPNVFQMSVGNVGARDSVVVNLHYSEAISYAEGEYEFVYPAVVGPRYASSTSPSEFQSVLSSLDLPKEIPGRFSISVNLATAVPVKSVLSPSHTLELNTINATSKRTAVMGEANSITMVNLAKNQSAGNRDVVLRYRLSGPAIESGLLLSKGKDENFFMLMVQPPRQVEIPNILPREYVFIVDVSGSMHGEPLNIAKKLMSDLLDKLRPTDKFNILAFSGSSKFLAENSLDLSPENKGLARAFFDNGYGGGGTELLPALRRAFAMKSIEGYSRNFVIITDGFVQCEPQAFELVRSNLNKANIYAMGIGTSVNRFLMEGLARAGNAEPLIVTNLTEAPKMAEKFREYIEAPVLTNISIDYGKLDVYDVDPISIADVSAKRPIVVFGKWKGDASGLVKLHGISAQGAYDVNMDLSAEPIRPENNALCYLWARNRIRMIQDGAVNGWGYPQALALDKQKSITDLGLKYNLLTDYTSFVAVDSVVSVDPQSNSFKAKPIIDSTLHTQRTQQEFSSVDNAQTALSVQSGPPSATQGGNRAVSTQFDPSTNRNYSVSPTTTGSINRRELRRVAPSKASQPTPEAAESKSQQSNATLSGSGGGVSVRGGRAAQTKVLVDAQDVSDPIEGGFGSAATSSGDLKYAPVAPHNTKAAKPTSTAPVSQADSVGSTRIVTTQQSSTHSLPSQQLQQSAQTTEDLNRQSTTATEQSQSSPLSGIPASSSGGTYVSSAELESGTDASESPIMAASVKRIWYAGPVFSYGQTNWTSDVSAVTPPSFRGNSFVAPDLKGSHVSLGWTIEYPSSMRLRSSRSSFSATLLYEHTSLSAERLQQANVWKESSFDSVQGTARISYLSELSVLRLGIDYRYTIPSTRLGFVIGLTPGFVLNSRTTNRATLDSGMIWLKPVENYGLSVDQSGRTLYLKDQAAVSNSFLLGVHVALQYEFDLRPITVIPFVYANPELLKADGTSMNLPVGLGLRVVFPIRL